MATKNNKHDLNSLKNSVDQDIPKHFQDQFEILVKKFSDIFSKSIDDLGELDVIRRQIDVPPESKPVKFTNRWITLHWKADM